MTGAPRRVLFVLRGKLGDSIAAYATVRAYADAFPGDEVTLLVRANYAPLFEREAGLRVIGFASRLAMFAKLARIRWFEPPFDALLVLLGAGPPIRRLGRMVRARRKIYLDGRFADAYPEWPEIPEPHLQSEPAWRVARLWAPDLPQPQRSQIASLAALRRPTGAIGIAPVSDEPRRTMGPEVVRALAESLMRKHPACAIHVIVNPDDEDAKALRRAGLPAGAEFREFPTLQALFAALSPLEALHSTDTGLYHLAAAMGIPVTVYFGPTQPWRNGFAAQPALARVRLAALGGEHCEEKGCLRPACLEMAVAARIGAAIASDVDGTPRGCLLRRHTPQDLGQLKVETAPDDARDGGRAVPVN